MRGVTIDFTGPTPVFNFNTVLVDFDTTVQNALVNVGTDLGSDPIFNDRGTYLFQDALNGYMINLEWANHAGNFAALRTIVFSQAHAMVGNPFGLQDLTLISPQYNIQNLNFNLSATCVDGDTRGTNATV